MSAPSSRQLFNLALATARAKEDWATHIRNFSWVVDGVVCNVHVKVQLIVQQVGRAPRITGECFVYLTTPAGDDVASGCGWVHFSLAESGMAHAERLFELALAEALCELRSKPEAMAAFERVELSATPHPGSVAPVAPARRHRL